MTAKKALVIGGAVVAVAVLAVVALVAVQLFRSDDPDLATEAPQLPAGTTTVATSTVASPTATSAAAASVTRFVVDSSGSSAKYVVREKLPNLPVSTNAVGETKDVTGDLYLTPTGLASGQPSKFRVDLRTLRSDESRRDNFIRMSSLQANQFPFAEFTIEEVSGYPASVAEGVEFPVTIRGSMTIRSVTKPVTWEAKVRRSGDAVSAVADTDFLMTDFGITPPDVPFAKSENGVHLQVVLVARAQPV